jgi:hypothetical protein
MTPTLTLGTLLAVLAFTDPPGPEALAAYKELANSPVRPSARPFDAVLEFVATPPADPPSGRPSRPS